MGDSVCASSGTWLCLRYHVRRGRGVLRRLVPTSETREAPITDDDFVPELPVAVARSGYWPAYGIALADAPLDEEPAGLMVTTVRNPVHARMVQARQQRSRTGVRLCCRDQATRGQRISVG